MASQHEILRVLSNSGPTSRNKIGEFVGEEYRGFQTQLDRLSHRGFIQDTGDHVYTLTDLGREALKTMDSAIKLSPGDGFCFSITETDLMMLDDKAFKDAWDLLGKIVRTRYPHPGKG